MPELISNPAFFHQVEPTWTHTDGRRFWRLTATVQVTIYLDGRIEIVDSGRPTFRVSTYAGRKGTEVSLVPRPDVA